MKKLLKILILIGIILIVLFISVFYLSKSRTFQLFGELVPRIETSEQVVALTFDDGPTKNTDRVLAILDRLGVKATFYVTGNELAANMEDAKKIVDSGHELGNHSYTHQRMVLKSSGFIQREIEDTDQLIIEAGYEGEIHFRPPFGKKLVYLPYYLYQHNKKTIMWDVEPETYPEVAVDAQKIVDYTVEQVKPGSIILLHVMYKSREQSIQAIEGIVTKLQAKGYRFVTVSELLTSDRR